MFMMVGRKAPLIAHSRPEHGVLPPALVRLALVGPGSGRAVLRPACESSRLGCQAGPEERLDAADCRRAYDS